jgi:hypothetical protein
VVRRHVSLDSGGNGRAGLGRRRLVGKHAGGKGSLAEAPPFRYFYADPTAPVIGAISESDFEVHAE